MTPVTLVILTLNEIDGVGHVFPKLPLGVVDEMFQYELAEHLHMTVQEMTTGEPGLSAHDLTSGWPTYLKYKHRARKRAEEKESRRRR